MKKWIVLNVLFLALISCERSTTGNDEVNNAIFESVESGSAIDNEVMEEEPLVSPSLIEQCIDFAQREYYPDYQRLDYIVGDLNQDKSDDIILILEIPNSEYTVYGDTVYDRKVVFLDNFVQLENPNYRVVAENDNIIECSDCGGAGVGDPLQEIVIRNDTIRFDIAYGSCSKEYISLYFLYNPIENDWFLERTKSIVTDCQTETEDGGVWMEETIETKKDFGTITFADYTDKKY